MLPKPEAGQIVRHESYDGKLIIKSVSPDGAAVDLVSASDPGYTLRNVPCPELLPAEGVDVG